MKTIIYGTHPVLEALDNRRDVVEAVWVSPQHEKVSRIKNVAKKVGATINQLDPRGLPKGLPEHAVHQGVAAQINTAKLISDYRETIEVMEVTNDTLVLVLAELTDPQNVGAVIRSAAAFGVSMIVVPKHKQAPITGAVAKVSAGMVFRIPIVEVSNINATIDDLKERDFWVYGLDAAGQTNAHKEEFTKPTALVLGSEGDGMREKTREHCDFVLSISVHERTESLNAATSAAVVLYEWSTQHPDALK